MPRSAPTPNRLAGSPPTHAEMEIFIRNEWADDQLMFEVLKYGIDVTSVSRDGAEIEVEVIFFYDPSDKEEIAYKLFDYEDSGFFPRSMPRCTLKERYIWEDSSGCDRLDNQSYYVEHLDLDVENFEWDDPLFPEDLFAACVWDFSRHEIGASLVTLYSADKAMPDFIPLRLRPYFQKLVAEYLAIAK